MSLNIKNPETERLARELATATGETVTQAVTMAVRERLDRVQQVDDRVVAERMRVIREIVEDVRDRWVEPWKSVDHGDLLYDERGLPK
ncbi:MAG: type II toxin-antitoxin system VapB family antitoxin [Candidatus Dormibacteraeota bacterium]|nr:type II toxin-antitoxin system VapB family antitoxin [Candidatus Dormibacteraeota bacterium]